MELSADDLNLILEIGLEMSGADNKPYLFLDEIQNVEGWPAEQKNDGCRQNQFGVEREAAHEVFPGPFSFYKILHALQNFPPDRKAKAA